MSIPSGTKFHGVAPGVDTENRGSANANADRDTYSIEEFNGSFKAYYALSKSVGIRYDTVVTLYTDGSEYVPAGVPADAVLVRDATGSAPFPQYKVGFKPAVGIIKAGSKVPGVVDVLVQGLQSPATIYCQFGVTPKTGDTLYAGGGGIITCGNPIFGDYLALGTVTGTNPVKTLDYGEYGAVWEVEAYYSFSAQSPYYVDGIPYKSSVRQPCYVPTGLDVEVGNIVKIGINSATSSTIYVERVSSSDPVESFAGIVADRRASPGTLSTDVPGPNAPFGPQPVCMSGNVFIPSWVINGADPVRGGLIYADATTPYKLTTDSTSGIVIGLVQTLTFDENGAIERVLIQVKL